MVLKFALIKKHIHTYFVDSDVSIVFESVQVKGQSVYVHHLQSISYEIAFLSYQVCDTERLIPEIGKKTGKYEQLYWSNFIFECNTRVQN